MFEEAYVIVYVFMFSCVHGRVGVTHQKPADRHECCDRKTSDKVVATMRKGGPGGGEHPGVENCISYYSREETFFFF